MVVNDGTMVYIALLTLNYLIIWRHKSKEGDAFVGHMLGDVGFIIMGFAAVLITGITVPWAWLISVIAGVHLLLTVSQA